MWVNTTTFDQPEADVLIQAMGHSIPYAQGVLTDLTPGNEENRLSRWPISLVQHHSDAVIEDLDRNHQSPKRYPKTHQPIPE